MIIEEEQYLMHYGILRKSGRYPWGSGETQNQRNADFLSTIKGLEKSGLSQKEIAAHFARPGDPVNKKTGENILWNTTRVRQLKSIASEEEKLGRIRQAERLKAEGKGNVEIARRLGMANESSVRSLLAPGAREKAEIIESTAAMLRDQVAKKGYVDVGSASYLDLPNSMKVSKDKLDTAVTKLQEEGYIKHYQSVPTGPNTKTSYKALGAPGSEWPREISQIKLLNDVHSPDGGKTWDVGIQPPIPISSKRVAVRYKEDGGNTADGVMFIRTSKTKPGMELDIGENQYAQVRVSVDKTHYLKGMAVKKDDLPPGIDIVFNTNKSNTGNKLDALKKIKGEDEDFFGAMIRQIKDPKTGKVTSAMNLVGKKEGAGVEGGWGEWSKSLSSQVLSKQKPALAEQQLAITRDRSRKELDEIKSLTNPTVKLKLLEAYAKNTDTKAVNLKAAELPGQVTHVILPVNSMKKGEAHAPQFENGTRVSLVRYPHGGTFEIPELVINNKNPEAVKLLGQAAKDAIGIHHSVAERLSGADFDGDTVLVIPHRGMGKLDSTPPLAGLKGFDHQAEYRIPKENTTIPRMKKENTGTEMGKITNLISDMTIKGAGHEDLTRAVKHSMVVIDAEKHGLDYRASFKKNGIAALKKEYQGVSEKGNLQGAATLITRAKSQERVDKRKLRLASQGGPIDPKTGNLVWTPTGEKTSGWDKKTNRYRPEKIKNVTEASKKLAETTDARTLLSDKGRGTPVERVYAKHSNAMKAMANEARLETLKIREPSKNPTSYRTYKPEVDSLNAKLRIAQANSPRERQARAVADAMHKLRKQEHPEWTKEEIKRDKNRSLDKARAVTGAKKKTVDVTPKEWEAIQAGAIAKSKLNQILNQTDLDVIKAYATPKERKLISSSDTARARSMFANGATQAEVAKALGVSLTTLKNSLA